MEFLLIINFLWTLGSERVVLSRADGLAVKVLKEKKTSMLVLSSEKNEIVKKDVKN